MSMACTMIVSNGRNQSMLSLNTSPALASGYAGSEHRDHLGYGAGRCVCPGIHLAERNLIIGVAKLFWAFEFLNPPPPLATMIFQLTPALVEGFFIAPRIMAVPFVFALRRSGTPLCGNLPRRKRFSLDLIS
ncbi:Cytochrome P450 [Penicillium majusculum]|nr:Cytochrome P450 [Penicillium majusculum]